MRCVHRSTGISVDVSFSEHKRDNPPLPFRSAYPGHSELLIALKAVLSSRGQHESRRGGLSSIRIALLLESYLQVLAGPSPPNSLVEVSRLRGFLMYITAPSGPLKRTLVISNVDFRGVAVRRVKAAFSDALRASTLSAMVRDYSSLVSRREESVRRAQAFVFVPFSGQGHLLGRGG